jgi:hypothetical protein
MWRCWYGRWWMVQLVLDGWVSLGVHLDFKHRRYSAGTYGPYVDLHLGVLILSLGWHPYLSTDLERCASYSRGGKHFDAAGDLY